MALVSASYHFPVKRIKTAKFQMHMHGKGRRACKCVGKCFEVEGAMKLKFASFCSS